MGVRSKGSKGSKGVKGAKVGMHFYLLLTTKLLTKILLTTKRRKL